MTTVVALFWFFSGLVSLFYNLRYIWTLIAAMQNTVSFVKFAYGVVLGLLHLFAGPASLLHDFRVATEKKAGLR